MAVEKWEYLTHFFKAHVKNKETREFIKQEFEMKRPPRYTPEALIPQLNELGDEGWELIHMEPVAAVGGKGDVRFDSGYWSNTYFCVFKRRKTEASNSASTPIIAPVLGQEPIPPHE